MGWLSALSVSLALFVAAGLPFAAGRAEPVRDVVVGAEPAGSSAEELFARAREARAQGDVPTARALTRAAAEAGHPDAAFAVAAWTHRRGGWTDAGEIYRLGRLAVSRLNTAHLAYLWLAMSAERRDGVASADQIALWYRLAAASVLGDEDRGLDIYDELETLRRDVLRMSHLPRGLERAVRWVRDVYRMPPQGRYRELRPICEGSDLRGRAVLCHTLLFDIALDGHTGAQGLAAKAIVALPVAHWRPKIMYLDPAQWWLCRAAADGDGEAAILLAELVLFQDDVSVEVTSTKLARLLHLAMPERPDAASYLAIVLGSLGAEAAQTFELRKDDPVSVVLC